MVPVRVALKYFPRNKGTVVAIILAGMGISPILFIFVCDYIINPNGEQLRNGYYSENVAENVNTYDNIGVKILFNNDNHSCIFGFT